MELDCKAGCSVAAGECWSMEQKESVVLGPLLCVLAKIPLDAWTEAYFDQPAVILGLSIGRAVVVSDPAAIRRVLLENCDNSEKDSASLIGGLSTVEDHNWRTPHSKTI